MSKFIFTEWVVPPSDFEFTVKHDKPADLNYKFRVTDDGGKIYAYGYSDSNQSTAPLSYCKVYGCTKIQYGDNNTGEYVELTEESRSNK